MALALITINGEEGPITICALIAAEEHVIATGRRSIQLATVIIAMTLKSLMVAFMTHLVRGPPVAPTRSWMQQRKMVAALIVLLTSVKTQMTILRAPLASFTLLLTRMTTPFAPDQLAVGSKETMSTVSAPPVRTFTSKTLMTTLSASTRLVRREKKFWPIDHAKLAQTMR